MALAEQSDRRRHVRHPDGRKPQARGRAASRRRGRVGRTMSREDVSRHSGVDGTAEILPARAARRKRRARSVVPSGQLRVGDGLRLDCADPDEHQDPETHQTHTRPRTALALAAAAVATLSFAAATTHAQSGACRTVRCASSCPSRPGTTDSCARDRARTLARLRPALRRRHRPAPGARRRRRGGQERRRRLHPAHGDRRHAVVIPRSIQDAYDRQDFAPITLVAGVPNVVVPTRRRRPNGSHRPAVAHRLARRTRQAEHGLAQRHLVHLAGELFKAMSGTYMVHSRTAAPAGADGPDGRDGGRHVRQPALAMPRSRRASSRLAVTSAERSAALPDLPTVEQAATSRVRGGSGSACWRPPAPADIVQKLQQETARRSPPGGQAAPAAQGAIPAAARRRTSRR